MDINSLDRFVEVQEKMYPIAMEEIQNGQKETHWMWYIFPQLRGLGMDFQDLKKPKHTLNIRGCPGGYMSSV